MKHSKKGEYYGNHNTIQEYTGLVVTDTEYTHDFVDWHYHENAYFTYILEGTLFEANKKEAYQCGAGSLLFHNWQDPHYNRKSTPRVHGFHIECDKNWFDAFDLKLDALQGSQRIEHPSVKTLFHKIYIESKLPHTASAFTTEDLLLQVFSELSQHHLSNKAAPQWAKRVKDIIYEQYDNTLTLHDLAKQLNVHPVHLSRAFPQHFHTTLGAYMRTVKVEKSLQYLSNPDMSLSEVAYTCGFADQSHFIRCFKTVFHINPLMYRKNVLKQ